jgi:hypothetical protein
MIFQATSVPQFESEWPREGKVEFSEMIPDCYFDSLIREKKDGIEKKMEFSANFL